MGKILFTLLPLFAIAMTSFAADKHPAIVTEEFIYNEAPFPSCHASTLVEVEPGVILAAWFGGTDEGEADVGIWVSRKENGNWSDPVEAASAPRVPCWNPVLFQYPDGEIFLFYKAGESPRAWSGLYKTSNDGGKTWSDEVLLPAGILGPIKNKPILLDDGTLVCGSSVESWRAWACWMELTGDRGKTWSKHGPIEVPDMRRGIIQPTLYLDDEGNLHSLMRATRTIGYVCHAVSKDGGKTWSDAKPTELPNPNAGVDAVRLKDGRIVLVYNPTKSGRNKLSIAVSEDYGETWEHKVVLEDQPGEFSYPAVIQASDGMIHTTYTWKRDKIKHVVLDPEKL